MDRRITAFEQVKRMVDFESTSLLSEGYNLSFKSVGTMLVFYRFKHSKNGNVIVFKGYPKDNSWLMLKNGKRIRSGKIIDHGADKVY